MVTISVSQLVAIITMSIPLSFSLGFFIARRIVQKECTMLFIGLISAIKETGSVDFKEEFGDIVAKLKLNFTNQAIKRGVTK